MKRETEPEQASLATKPIVLGNAYEEFCTRRATGEIVDADAYCTQFPSLKSSLYRMIEAHLFLEENPFLIADPAPIHWPEAGQGFMGYHLVHELGRGTFARVYLAKAAKLGSRNVVIKIAQHGGAEAKIMGRIEHPNIVPVHSVQEDPDTGVTVVCMPYLGDATLCDVLDNIEAKGLAEYRATTILDSVADAAGPTQAPARPRLAARVLRRGSYVDGIRFLGVQLADALAYIHGLGIFHRDIKPSNVLMSSQGVPMLLDFNLSADVKLTTIRVGGTFPYMPPEQLQPLVEQGFFDPSSLDARSDLFSLAVILYQLLTGSHPFGPLPLKNASTDLCPRLLDRQRQGPVHVSDLNPQVDRAFGDVIQRCLAFAANDRPSTAAEVAGALRQGLTPLSRTRRWLGRHSRAVLAASALLMTLTGSAAVVAYNRPSHNERQIEAGLAQYKQGHYQESLELFSTALSSDPKQASVWFARGQAYQRLGANGSENYRLAIDDFLKADELATSAAEKGRNQAAIGYCWHLLGNHREAIAAYESAIEVGFISAEVSNNLGYARLVTRQKFDQAQQALDQAIFLNPGQCAAYYNRALLALGIAEGKFAHLHVGLDPNTQQIANPQRLAQIREECVAGLKASMADVETALKLASPSAELRYTAACIYGYSAGRLDTKYMDRAFEHLTATVKQGWNPRKLADDALLASLSDDPRFQTLLVMPPAPAPPPAMQRIVDPTRNDPG